MLGYFIFLFYNHKISYGFKKPTSPDNRRPKLNKTKPMSFYNNIIIAVAAVVLKSLKTLRKAKEEKIYF